MSYIWNVLFFSSFRSRRGGKDRVLDSQNTLSDQQEKILAEYFKSAADLFYGLSTKEVGLSKKKVWIVGLSNL